MQVSRDATHLPGVGFQRRFQIGLGNSVDVGERKTNDALRVLRRAPTFTGAGNATRHSSTVRTGTGAFLRKSCARLSALRRLSRLHGMGDALRGKASSIYRFAGSVCPEEPRPARLGGPHVQHRWTQRGSKCLSGRALVKGAQSRLGLLAEISALRERTGQGFEPKLFRNGGRRDRGLREMATSLQRSTCHPGSRPARRSTPALPSALEHFR